MVCVRVFLHGYNVQMSLAYYDLSKAINYVLISLKQCLMFRVVHNVIENSVVRAGGSTTITECVLKKDSNRIVSISVDQLSTCIYLENAFMYCYGLSFESF